jgi:hypothetical protein
MGFSNPIIAGETLVVPGIQSDGYVAATTGWRVEREGNAEFNDVDMRGTLDIVGPDYPPAGSDESRIRILVAGFRPVIQLDDSFGRTYEIGADDNSLYIKALASPNSRINLVHDLGIAIRSDATGAPSVLFDDADGFLKVGAYSPWVVNGWQAQALSSGAGTVSRKMMPDGTVMLRGSQAPAANVVGTALFTLPVGWRPTQTVRFETASGAASAGGRIQIDAAGACVIAFPAAIASYWYDGIRFSVI